MCNTESSVPIFSNASSIILIFFPYICQLTLKSTHLPGRYMFCKQCTLLNLSAFITTILPILSVYQLAEWQQKSIFHAYQITRPPLHTCKTKDGHLFLLSMGNSFVFFFFFKQKIPFLFFSKDKHNLSSFLLWLQTGIWLLVSLLVKKKVIQKIN